MTSPPLIFGPIPPYQNVPIEPQYYQPSRFVITAVATGINTTVTTSVNHNYVVGQQVRLLIPFGWGCTSLNKMEGQVIAIPAANQVTTNINSQHANQFFASGLNQLPEILAIGDVNSGAINPNVNFQFRHIPGSFIDISPR